MNNLFLIIMRLFLKHAILGIAAILPFTVAAQKKTDSTSIHIKWVKEEFAKINADSTQYRVIEEELEGESTEGGSLRRSYDGNSLRKAILQYFGETGKITTEYYFTKDSSLFFVYAKEDRYNHPIYIDGSKIVSTKENRYYLKDGHLIRWIGPDKKIINTGMYGAKEEELMEEVSNF